MKVGDKVKIKVLPYRTGKIVRIDNPDINPYCVLVQIDMVEWQVGCFKPEHLLPSP